MSFRSFSVQGATIRGVEAIPVSVEVVISNGLPGFAIVGMADAAIQESRERVKAALRSSGFVMPNEKIVVNLAPGALRKTGSGFDLPIALGILAATGQIDAEVVRRALVVGELSLGGGVRCSAGSFPMCASRASSMLLCLALGTFILQAITRRFWGTKWRSAHCRLRQQVGTG